MLPKPLRMLWGDLTLNEVKKFGILAATFFLIIGAYWMLRVCKNTMFEQLVGFEQYQPWAKGLSLLFIAVTVMIYSKLLDVFARHILFYLILAFYGISFVLLYFAYNNPDFALISSSSWLVSWIPGHFIGWFGYVFLESFGSITPALFWALVASTTTVDSAKRGYGMVYSLTQLGVILGPSLVLNFAPAWGTPTFFLIGGIVIACVIPLIYVYTHLIPSETVHEVKDEKKTGFMEGARLLVSHGYLLGILVVVTMYEVISTIVEYQMNTLATKTFTDRDAFATFTARQGVYVGVLSLLFALLGTSFFMRKFGLKFCLVAFPVIIGVIMVANFGLWTINIDSTSLMWSFFYSVIVFKGLSYTLNNPAKEIMYIPTSKDVKFKAKGWIDAFGNRSSKLLGSGVNIVLKNSLMIGGTAVSLALIAFWTFMALFVGNTFDKLQKEKKIIQ